MTLNTKDTLLRVQAIKKKLMNFVPNKCVLKVVFGNAGERNCSSELNSSELNLGLLFSSEIHLYLRKHNQLRGCAARGLLALWSHVTD